MRSSLATVLPLSLLSGLAAAQYSSNVSSSACPSPNGVHMIVARASTEQEGYGVIGIVKDAILSRIPGSNAEFVVYPATLNDYFNSESAGVVAMRALITAFNTNCPNYPMVVMGYSQGAQVTADSLVGQEDNGFVLNSTIDTPLSSTIFNQTAAVIMMGDPTFNNTETFHVGNATKNSLFPRHDVERFNVDDLAARTQSYCDANDPYCAAGNNLAVHLGYVQEYGAAAESFVVNQVRAWYGNPTIGSNTTAVTTASSMMAASGIATMSAMRPSGSGVRPSGTAVGTASGTGVVGPTMMPSSVTAPTTPSKTANAAAGVRGSDAVTGALVGGLFAWMML